MGSAWDLLFGGGDPDAPQPNRAQRRAQERDLRRMQRRSVRAYQRRQRQIEAMARKDETDAEA